MSVAVILDHFVRGFRACVMAAVLVLLMASVGKADSDMPSGTGVNIHFLGGHTNELRMIARAGFKFIRTDCVWSDIERQKGEYDWSAQDELTSDLLELGLRPIYVLDYSNPLYEQQIDGYALGAGKPEKVLSAPTHPESVAAFARWCAAAANRYRGKQITWEIYNEPNIIFWQPQPGAHQYAALATAAAKAIREADPDPQNKEHRFGIVNEQLAPKPAYQAAAVLNRELSGYKFMRRLEGSETNAWLLLFTNAANDYKLVGWTTGRSQRVVLDLSQNPIIPPTGCHMDGKAFSPKWKEKRLTADLSSAPDYISLGDCRPENLSATAVPK